MTKIRRKIVNKWDTKRTEQSPHLKKNPFKQINWSLIDLKLVYLGQIK